MSERQDIKVLEATGQATEASSKLTRYDLITALIEMFRAPEMRSEKFPSLKHRLEDVPVEELREISTNDTVLEPLVRKLGEMGAPTPPTLGGVMDTLNLSRKSIHQLACYCHGHDILGNLMAYRLEVIRNSWRWRISSWLNKR